jgi:hypothetical protein
VPVGRVSTLDSALTLARSLAEIWPGELADVIHSRILHNRHPGLGARDLLHLAYCQRPGIRQIKAFDQALASAFGPWCRVAATLCPKPRQRRPLSKLITTHVRSTSAVRGCWLSTIWVPA